MQLSDIAKALSATLSGDGSLEIRRVVHPADADGNGDLAVALSGDATQHLAGTRAAAVLIPPTGAPPAGAAAIVYGGSDRVAVATLTALFDPGPAHGTGIHPSAVVAPDAVIEAGANVGPGVVIGAGSRVGAGTTILAQVTVGAGVSVGRDCVLYPGVRLMDRVRLGDRVIIHSNTVIGSDGFSFIPVSNPDGSSNGIERPMRTHSLGTVVIADDVEIGSGSTIDRATLRETSIGRGTKIDNQVQIGHNVVIGENCLICGMSGIAGSTVLGDQVVIASGVGVAPHLTIGAGATVAAGSGLASHVPAGAVFMGLPAIAQDRFISRLADIGRLRQLYPRVDELRKRIETLENEAKGR
jgi:UDP-3-O-[3-hydroxymyristoyl] glucosamine N-acyltransferase